jgi:ABC-type Fe3+ transport system substrate-binding protein
MEGLQPEINLNVGCRNLQRKRDRHSFVGYSPRTLRDTFEEGLGSVLRRHQEETGTHLTTCFSSSSGVSDTCHQIWETSHIDKFPDVVASMGFDCLFGRKFFHRFVEKGYFKSVSIGPVNVPFEGAGFGDPDGWYTVYAVQPFVMLVDKRKLGDIPVPGKWSDLLKPRFEGKVILGGSDDPGEDVPLLYFYKEHGVEGLSRLAANVRALWYANQIAPIVSSSDQGGAAVYILSWPYARSCPETDFLTVIWPEDGALANPLCLLVKNTKMEQLAPIVDYVMGREFGVRCARYSFPSLNPYVDNELPEGAAFKWLGWDYIKSRDTAELRDRVYRLFLIMKREAQRKRGS